MSNRPKGVLLKDQLLQVVSPDLLRILTAMFPNQLPEGDFDLREVDRKVGEQNVIRAIRHALTRLENPERPKDLS